MNDGCSAISWAVHEKGIQVKRLEQAALSGRRFPAGRSYERFIAMYESGTVLISKDVNVYDLPDGQDTKNNRTLSKEVGMRFKSDRFSPALLKVAKYDDQPYLQSCGRILTRPLLQFKTELTEDSHQKAKAVILLTESKERAAVHLFDELARYRR